MSKNNSFLSDFKEFFQGFFGGLKDNSINVIKKDAIDLNDYFALLCFSDFLGIPSPASYYTLEMLPYMAKELEGWQKRMAMPRDVISEEMGKYDIHVG